MTDFLFRPPASAAFAWLMTLHDGRELLGITKSNQRANALDSLPDGVSYAVKSYLAHE